MRLRHWERRTLNAFFKLNIYCYQKWIKVEPEMEKSLCQESADVDKCKSFLDELQYSMEGFKGINICRSKKRVPTKVCASFLSRTLTDLLYIDPNEALQNKY